MPSSTGSPLLSPGTATVSGADPAAAAPQVSPGKEFVAMSRNAPAVDLEAFRADQDTALDHEAGSPYER
jgi:hypothetical protein